MKHNKQSIVKETESMDSRRKFLVKGAATALVATLPVKTSWARSGGHGGGCMVSGNLSGNQSAVCEAVVVSGKSPEDWYDDCSSSRYVSGTARTASTTPWGTIFSFTPTSGYSRGGYKKKDNRSSVSSSSSLYEILERGGDLEQNLVAGYLNALDNRYPLKPGVTAEMYASMLEAEAENDEAALIQALEQTYTYRGGSRR